MNLTHWMTTIGHALTPIFGRLDAIMVGRMLLTLLLCGLIGLERSAHERASGFRPHILVGLAACLMTLAGGYGFPDKPGGGDPMRVASYVVSGIGFLGAGAILRHGTTVRGLTTAASLWSAAGIGLAVGAGLGTLAAVSAVLILFTLQPLQTWESRLRFGSYAGDIAIHLRDDKAVGKTLALLTSQGIGVRRAVILPGAGTSVILNAELAVAMKAQDAPALIQRLLAQPYIERVDTAHLNIEGETGTSEIGGVPVVDHTDPRRFENEE